LPAVALRGFASAEPVPPPFALPFLATPREVGATWDDAQEALQKTAA